MFRGFVLVACWRRKQLAAATRVSQGLQEVMHHCSQAMFVRRYQANCQLLYRSGSTVRRHETVGDPSLTAERIKTDARPHCGCLCRYNTQPPVTLGFSSLIDALIALNF